VSNHYIRFEDELGDKLRRVSWAFWLYGSNLVLNEYVVETRPSRRHAYKVARAYTRLSSSRWRDGSVVDEEDVPLTPAIAERALREYVSQLRVVRWSEVRR
jgi:hypothetical protein